MIWASHLQKIVIIPGTSEEILCLGEKPARNTVSWRKRRKNGPLSDIRRLAKHHLPSPTEHQFLRFKTRCHPERSEGPRKSVNLPRQIHRQLGNARFLQPEGNNPQFV